MAMKKMLFEVEVHRTSSWDTYRVLANEDLAARKRAVELDERFVADDTGPIVYCETRLVSKVDSA